MELKVTTLDGKDAGKVTLSEAIFGLEPREDILQRMVRWQLAKRQQGTHKLTAAPRSPAPAPRCTGRRAPAAPAIVRARPAVPRRRQGARPGRAQP